MARQDAQAGHAEILAVDQDARTVGADDPSVRSVVAGAVALNTDLAVAAADDRDVASLSCTIDLDVERIAVALDGDRVVAVDQRLGLAVFHVGRGDRERARAPRLRVHERRPRQNDTKKHCKHRKAFHRIPPCRLDDEDFARLPGRMQL